MAFTPSINTLLQYEPAAQSSRLSLHQTSIRTLAPAPPTSPVLSPRIAISTADFFTALTDLTTQATREIDAAYIHHPRPYPFGVDTAPADSTFADIHRQIFGARDPLACSKRAWQLLNKVIRTWEDRRTTTEEKIALYKFLCSPVGEDLIYTLSRTLDSKIKPRRGTIALSTEKARADSGVAEDAAQLGKIFDMLEAISHLSDVQQEGIAKEFSVVINTILTALLSFGADEFMRQKDLTWPLRYFTREVDAGRSGGAPYLGYVRALEFFIRNQSLEEISTETLSLSYIASKQLALSSASSSSTEERTATISSTRANSLLQAILERLTTQKAALIKTEANHDILNILYQTIESIIAKPGLRLEKETQFLPLFELTLQKSCCFGSSVPERNRLQMIVFADRVEEYCRKTGRAGEANSIHALAHPPSSWSFFGRRDPAREERSVTNPLAATSPSKYS